MLVLAIAAASALAGAPSPKKVAPAPPSPKTVSSPLGFELTLPGDFAEVASAQNERVRHVWARNVGKPDLEQVSIQAYLKTIGRECPPADKLPAGVGQIKAAWDEMQLCGYRIEKASDAGPTVDLGIEVPLAGGAINMHVTGFPKNEAMLRARLDELLKTLKGKTSWRAYFGCYSMEIPEGWGLLKSASPDNVVMARRAPSKVNGQDYHPQISVVTKKNGAGSLDQAEANAVAETKAITKEKVETQRIQFAGQPASELRFTHSSDGKSLKVRALVIPWKEGTHLITVSSIDTVAKEVQPVGDVVISSARYSCASETR